MAKILENLEDELKLMELDELKRAQKIINDAVENYEARKKAEALAALTAQAKEFGFSINELIGGDSKKGSRGAVAKKYMNPNNHADQWTGRGRKPKWVEEHLENGGTLEDLLIEKVAKAD